MTDQPDSFFIVLFTKIIELYKRIDIVNQIIHARRKKNRIVVNQRSCNKTTLIGFNNK